MNKRWRNIGLYVLIVVVVIFVGSAFFDKPSPTKSSRTLRYSDFIEAVQEKQISRVLISPDKGTAEIIISKQRNGPIFNSKLTFIEECTRFENFQPDIMRSEDFK